MRRISPLLLVLALAACGGAETPVPADPRPVPSEVEPELPAPERPIPYPVMPPPEFQRAIAAGTRTATGAPGEAYWQQWAEYDIEARLDVEANTLSGRQTIRYHNQSPTRLGVLVLNLPQNYHAEGVERVRPTDEVTGGMPIDRVGLDGRELGPTSGRRQPGWFVEGTLMYVVPPEPVAPGGVVELELEWSFAVPRAGASGRMGREGDELFYIAYWYPQMASYDDVIGWHVEPFRGNAEFYSGFAEYELTIDVPAGWLVMSTGALRNAEEVLRPEVVERLRRAESSDDGIEVVAHGAAGSATAAAPTGRLRWQFHADSVRDVAFAAMSSHAWDAARAPVGDRDGDGEPEYTRVDAFWRSSARYWDDAWRYGQHSTAFLSDYTGMPYPWPHMSAVEGGGIIGGGMEFPMMTIIGDYNQRGADALYYVTAHEIGHMWLPMALSTNERRYAWLDEGTTTFLENVARTDFFPGSDPYAAEQGSYLRVAGTGTEGPIMRWSDFHRPGPAYGIASYAKPASVLHALRGVLGEETFHRALRTFFDRWAFRHPYPWDFWNTFEDVSGRELDWFWRSWYYESAQDAERWYLDQAIEEVERLDTGEWRITVRDLGWVPMPVHLTITRADGDVLERTIPVDAWLRGADQASVTIPAGDRLARVEIDAAGYFPDLDRSNNVWTLAR